MGRYTICDKEVGCFCHTLAGCLVVIPCLILSIAAFIGTVLLFTYASDFTQAGWALIVVGVGVICGLCCWETILMVVMNKFEYADYESRPFAQLEEGGRTTAYTPGWYVDKNIFKKTGGT